MSSNPFPTADEATLERLAGRYGPVRTLSLPDAVAIADMLTLKETAKGEAARVVGEWLVRRAKKLDAPLAGLRFFRRTSDRRRFLLVSYHPPAQLCWAWGLTFAFAVWPGRFYSGWFKLGYWHHGSGAVRVPFIGEISFQRQNYSWMLSSNAENRLRFLSAITVLRGSR